MDTSKFSTPYHTRPRVNHGGNYCGHDPNNPDFSMPFPIQKGRVGDKKGAPPLVIATVKRLPQFFNRPEILPSLNRVNGSKKNSKMRSERREGTVKVLSAIMKFMDIASLRVGIPSADGFINLPHAVIAHTAGIHIKRCQNIIADLKNAGLLTVSQPRELLEDGTWRGLASVKAVNKELFGMFGLEETLKYERAKAVSKLKARAAELQRKKDEEEEKRLTNVSRTERIKYRHFLGNLSKNISKNESKKSKPATDNSRDNLAAKKLQAQILMAVHDEFPDWSHDQKLEEANRRLSKRLAG